MARISGGVRTIGVRGQIYANATLAQQRVDAALVKALAPICVTNFQTAAHAPEKLGELKKIGMSWARESFIREGKWAEFGHEQTSPVVDACADALFKL
jgi:hypothetical protein